MPESPRRIDAALLLLGALLTLRGYGHLFLTGIEGLAAEWRGLGLP